MYDNGFSKICINPGKFGVHMSGICYEGNGEVQSIFRVMNVRVNLKNVHPCFKHFKGFKQCACGSPFNSQRLFTSLLEGWTDDATGRKTNCPHRKIDMPECCSVSTMLLLKTPHVKFLMGQPV